MPAMCSALNTTVGTGDKQMIVQPSFRETILTFFRRKFTFLLVFGARLPCGRRLPADHDAAVSVRAPRLVVRFDQQTVPDIDQTRTPQQPLGSNERREILYSDADILRSPDLARRTVIVELAWRASIRRSPPTTRARRGKMTMR